MKNSPARVELVRKWYQAGCRDGSSVFATDAWFEELLKLLDDAKPMLAQQIAALNPEEFEILEDHLLTLFLIDGHWVASIVDKAKAAHDALNHKLRTAELAAEELRGRLCAALGEPFVNPMAATNMVDVLHGQRDALRERLSAAEAQLAEMRAGYLQLDKNWETHHEACMRPIREAIGDTDATVHEIVTKIKDAVGEKARKPCEVCLGLAPATQQHTCE